MDAKKTADEIIGGRRLTREDDWQFLLDAPLEELTQGADRIRQALCGKEVVNAVKTVSSVLSRDIIVPVFLNTLFFR